MDSQERLNLQKEYETLPDEDILDMLTFNKDEYEQGVYELILEEARKRGIDKNAERKEVSIKDTVVSGAIVQKAIISILEKKGIATRQELMDEVKNIKSQIQKEKGGL